MHNMLLVPLFFNGCPNAGSSHVLLHDKMCKKLDEKHAWHNARIWYMSFFIVLLEHRKACSNKLCCSKNVQKKASRTCCGSIALSKGPSGGDVQSDP